MCQPDVVARTMSEFHAAGYTTEARMLSVPREMSLLGVIERYAYQVQENGSGRWGPVNICDAAYSNLPSSLETLVTRGAVDRVVVTIVVVCPCMIALLMTRLISVRLYA